MFELKPLRENFPALRSRETFYSDMFSLSASMHFCTAFKLQENIITNKPDALESSAWFERRPFGREFVCALGRLVENKKIITTNLTNLTCPNQHL